jgi:hypothetical protein
MTGCRAEREWCKGLTAIASVMSLLVVVLSILATAQAAKIQRLEDRGDTIVELKTDMNYVKTDLREIKTILQKRP